MTPFSPTLSWLEQISTGAIDAIAKRPWISATLLIAVALLCYLPGLLALPPVDRTEIIYAESSRAMMERGDPLDARFLEERYAFRPIGIYWLQIASGKLLGPAAWNAISTYRLPSLLGALLAVLAVWWLLCPLLGPRGSLTAAALYAVTPIVALQAQLSIPEGPLLLAAAVAQLTLLRLYCAADDERHTGLALSFWTAQGFGILINALAVPILSLSTIIALFIFDRNLEWLKRLRPLLGVPLMVLLAAPWLLVRAHIDGGVPFSTLTWGELLRALGGGQDMKWKAAPLTFTLSLVLGFLPGAVLLIPSIKGLWTGRAAALNRFLFAWLAGYLVYLELIASKPALYTVQAMFPAAAAAAALALKRDGRLEIPPGMLRLPWWFVLAGMAALFAGVVWIAGTPPSVCIVIGALVVTALFTLAAISASRGLAAAWLAAIVVGFALFLGFTFGALLPHLKKGWPAPRITEAIAPLQRCVSGPVGVLGFREPSTVFVLGRQSKAGPETIADWIAKGKEGIAVVEDRWHAELQKELRARGAKMPERAGCVEAFNVMRGCPLSFSIYVTGSEKLDASCAAHPANVCKGPIPAVPQGGSAKSRCH
ncbi:MAG: ArnT family glycosyltransferase [Hyphomicrobium sp.]